MRSRHLTAVTDEQPTTGPVDLAGLAGALAACSAAWARFAVHDPEHRVHVRLAAGAGWEAYLITWPSGHGVELHDHGASRGAVAVVAGSLVELVARPDTTRPDATRGRIVRQRIGAGTVRPVPPGRIHDVVNAGRFPATSIHVYGPTLETMTFYDDELRPTRTERVFPETPLLALDEVSSLLATPLG
jgi:predicted metal-dependent enzyme (double-stranded beta helix superfamily)